MAESKVFTHFLCNLDLCGMFINMFLLFCLGKLLDQKSPYFQDEFPELAVGPEEKAQQSKKEEESKESQYGPGPSLRPQSN